MLTEEVKQKLIESQENVTDIDYKIYVKKVIEANDINARILDFNFLGHVSYKSLDLIKLVLSFGADINSNNNNWYETSLMIVAAKGDIESVRYLLSLGANVDMVDCFGFSALFHACKWGLNEIAKELILHGANVNLVVDNEKSILMHAMERGKLELIKLLVESGANINYIDKRGDTALMYAVKYGKRDIVSYLISKGARLDIYNKNGFDALSIAQENGYTTMVNILSLKIKTKEEIEEELKESTESFNKLVKKLTF